MANFIELAMLMEQRLSSREGQYIELVQLICLFLNNVKNDSNTKSRSAILLLAVNRQQQQFSGVTTVM